MSLNFQPSLPHLFKGIALFTPGGDLVYCIDPGKQNRWHLHLCAALQEMLDLPEPPHFLVPCYTATLDRWLDANTNQVQVFAEAYSPVLKHQALLSAIFQTEPLAWKPAPWHEGLCDPVVLALYHQQFPQLWESHDLIVRFDQNEFQPYSYRDVAASVIPQAPQQPETQGYVFRLFVSGNSTKTEQILTSLHQILERSLRYPYTLKVVDIFKHPEQAEEDQVSATPTLVKVWPRPVRKIIGDLENVDQLLRLLGASDELRDSKS